MVDAEKVKAGLRICSSTKRLTLGCNECPYLNEVLCVGSLASDAAELIALLEERIAIMQESMEALEKRQEDPDRIKVIRCADCAWWESNNAEEGDTSGYCRKNAECENALTDMTFFCGSADRR